MDQTSRLSRADDVFNSLVLQLRV